MDKKTGKYLLIAAVGALAIYLAIRWYENKKSNQYGSTQGGAGLGSNLNSVAPELIGGSTGPSIGPALSTPITINVTSSMPDNSLGANPVGSMVSRNNVTPSPLALANPDNSATGAQDAAPVPDDQSGGGITSAGSGTTAMTPADSTEREPTVKTGTTPAMRGTPVTPVKSKPPATSTPKTHEPAPHKPIRREGHPKQRRKPVRR